MGILAMFSVNYSVNLGQ